MEDMISRNDAYNTLTEYYHHTTEIQHKALREALERVPNSQPELIEREAYIRGFEQGKTQGRLDALSAQPETHDKRTETHACDLIERQAAIEALKEAFNPSITNFVKAKMALEALPSAQPEIVRCKDCPHSDTFPEGADNDMPLKCLGIRYGGVMPDWYCEHAERRTDEM